MFFQKKITLFKRECRIISRDLVCYKFTTAERCSKIADKFSDCSKNITAGAVVTQFIKKNTLQ